VQFWFLDCEITSQLCQLVGVMFSLSGSFGFLEDPIGETKELNVVLLFISYIFSAAK
jgi:hypothetical protein